MTKKKRPEDLLPPGRPTKFTPEFQQFVLDKIANGLTERAVFELPNTPDWTAWCQFKRNCIEKNPTFLRQLAEAEKDWCAWAERELIRVGYNEDRDYHRWEEVTEHNTTKNSGTVTKRGVTSDNTAVQRDKLKSEALIRLMKAKRPDLYGDKVTAEHTGKNGENLFTPVVNITISKNGK